jgi:outer membrane protein assembly factor BamD
MRGSSPNGPQGRDGEGLLRYPSAVRAIALVSALVALSVPGTVFAKKNKKNQEGQYLTATDIYRQGLREIEEDDLRQAQAMLEQISYAPENREELEPLVRLGIADATFYQSYGVSLIDARSLYLDFVALYGDHPAAPYAQLQAGVCSLGQVVHPSRDQSQTHQAIADLRIVAQRWPRSMFAPAARVMIHKAEHNLAEHSFTVGKFYLKRKAPMAAVQRFQEILDHYPHWREREKLYLYLGQAQLRAGNDTEARIYLDKLVTDYPHGEFRKTAKRELKKAGGPLEKYDVTGLD